ncbi:MAG: hypothetical protein NPIRA05_07210 [Nitrospirales bacterium]|nr:MAG: hypothetical protein NPIRA05_07210 [Nitrospirales bacterium]
MLLGLGLENPNITDHDRVVVDEERENATLRTSHTRKANIVDIIDTLLRLW